MSHYRFHLYQRETVVLDPEGYDLTDITQARANAIAAARDLICGDARAGVIDMSGHIEIVDADGTLLDTVRFREAVQLIDDEWKAIVFKQR